MTAEELFFFDKSPRALPLYDAFRAAVLVACPEATPSVARTQIAFRAGRQFAFAWLDRKDGSLMTAFCLPERCASTRLMRTVEPYPGRWMHHLRLTEPAQADEELTGWLRAAAAFARTCR